MKKLVRTYLKGCEWCGATGFVTNPYNTETTGAITGVCPVCHGAKTIEVKEYVENNSNNFCDINPYVAGFGYKKRQVL